MEQQAQLFDVIVIGSGPGGYPAAIKAAQYGKKVALVEAKELGGTCLNRGCIPSKTLIASADVLEQARTAGEFGIHLPEISFNFTKMADRKDEIVKRIRKSLEGLIAANEISIIRGFGKLIAKDTVEVTLDQKKSLLSAPKIILATGSEPRNISAFPFDGRQIHDSTSLLALKKLPKSLAIIGGGIIGCEFASLYATLGVEVTILEMMPGILPMESQSISTALSKVFKKKGIRILTEVKVESVDTFAEHVAIKLSGQDPVTAEMCLVAVGRALNTKNMGMETVGIKILETGLVAVNDRMETNIDGIYAIGDIASKWWLAHVATHQGLIAASNACGHDAHMHYEAVPSVIYTSPEIGTVGLSLESALEKGHKEAVIGAFPFQALGKSQATNHTEGFAQIVVDKRTGQILGAQVMGHEASSLIAPMALAVANELTIECITETIHAHPTIAEAWLEAALIAGDMPLHFPPKLSRK